MDQVKFVNALYVVVSAVAAVIQHHFENFSEDEASETCLNIRRFRLFRKDMAALDDQWNIDWFSLNEKMSQDRFHSLYGLRRQSLLSEVADHGFINYRKWYTDSTGKWSVAVKPRHNWTRGEQKFSHADEKAAEAYFFETVIGQKVLFMDHCYRAEVDVAHLTKNGLITALSEGAEWLAITDVQVERRDRLLAQTNALLFITLSRWTGPPEQQIPDDGRIDHDADELDYTSYDEMYYVDYMGKSRSLIYSHYLYNKIFLFGVIALTRYIELFVSCSPK